MKPWRHAGLCADNHTRTFWERAMDVSRLRRWTGVLHNANAIHVVLVVMRCGAVCVGLM